MTTKRGWREAAEELGLEVAELSDFGMASALTGEIDGHFVEVIHDPDSVRDTRARMTVGLSGPVGDGVFDVGPYAPPRQRMPAFHKPVITGDPPFNVRFTIDATEEHREAALAFLDARRRSLLMALQAVTPELSFSARPDRARLSCWSVRRPSGDNVIRIIQAKLRVAGALALDASPDEMNA